MFYKITECANCGYLHSKTEIKQEEFEEMLKTDISFGINTDDQCNEYIVMYEYCDDCKDVDLILI